MENEISKIMQFSAVQWTGDNIKDLEKIVDGKIGGVDYHYPDECILVYFPSDGRKIAINKGDWLVKYDNQILLFSDFDFKKWICDHGPDQYEEHHPGMTKFNEVRENIIHRYNLLAGCHITNIAVILLLRKLKVDISDLMLLHDKSDPKGTEYIQSHILLDVDKPSD